MGVSHPVPLGPLAKQRITSPTTFKFCMSAPLHWRGPHTVAKKTPEATPKLLPLK